ncbi:hypothetical protein [Pandoraea sp. ISTKB]|uniref:hypothetical protein n=1 Tax=Pandoraea sp. ISTKB TaxID=1586708 RepID=UPI0008469E68|nr:hypothetical protein [Pandoraea sp. ISTKB]ODP32481.1 hypothetical protein A9762_22860 [Pandoraea sp. ISTKB]
MTSKPKSKALLRNDNAPARSSQRVPNGRKNQNGPSPDATIDPNVVVQHPNDFPPDVPPYNLIRTDTLGNPLTFTAPLYDGMYAGWEYRIYIDAQWDDKILQVDADDITAGFLTIELAPEVYVIEDVHSFMYDCKSEIETIFNDPCQPVLFTIDREAPGAPMLGELEFPDEVDGSLTDALLTQLGDVLVGEVPSYYGRVHGDTLVGFVRNLDGDEEVSVAVQIPYGTPTTQPIELEFTRAMLANLGDGLLTFTYRVTDLAGNESLESEPVIIDVYLTPGIADLDPPMVPLFDDDDDTAPNFKIINEEDARTPVTVQIPGHADIVTGDRVVVLWGNREQPPVTFTGPDGTIPVILDIQIPYGEVAGEWSDTPPDGDGYAAVDVTYILYRAGRELGRPQAPHPVNVNLDTAGGVDPDPETPENEALGAPYVHHSQWNNDQVNFIPDAAIEEDHEFFVPWFKRDENGNPTGEDAFRAADLIFARYGGTALAVKPVLVDDINDKVDMLIVLPWAVVKAEGSGMKEIQYTVGRYYPPENGENISLSPSAEVTVVDSGDIPGGPDGLLSARFDETHVLWSYVSREGHAPITVKAYESMRIGDVVRVHVTADEYNPVDQSYGDPYLRAEWGGPNGEGEHPVYPFEITVTDLNVDKDLTFGWPLERAEWTYPYGMARVTYKVTRADGSNSAEAPPDADQRTDMSGRGEPPEEPLSMRTAKRPTVAEMVTLSRSVPRKEYQAALNKFVNQWRTSPQRRKSTRERRLNSGRAVAPVARADDTKLSPIQKKLREISMRPIPKTEPKE